MKRTLLALALTLAVVDTYAADPTPAPTPAPVATAAPVVAAAPVAAPATGAGGASAAARASAPTPAPVARVIEIERRTPAPTAQVMSDKDAASARAQLDELRGQMRELSRKMGELSTQLGDTGPRTYAYRYLGDPDRALIGIVMWPHEQGVKIAGVTPGGPADKAGVKNGDIVLAIDGKLLAGKGDKGDKWDKGDKGDKGEGAAVGEATRLLHELKVDQPVVLTVVRDGKKSDIKVKAERREALSWPRNFTFEMNGKQMEVIDHREQFERQREHADQTREIQLEIDTARDAARDVAETAREAAEDARREAHEHRIETIDVRRIAERARQQAVRSVHLRMPWWGLNLTNLNKDLGTYFGTEQGVLVLNADEESMSVLKSGDVLQAIGGKKVDNPEDAMRLLRDAEPGSTVQVQVLRQKKAMTLSMKSPELRTMFPPLPPEPPEAPEPPEPPAPPSHRAPPAPPAPPTPPAPPAHDGGGVSA